ncbi:MAG: sigma-70 family RNA polymerase sigma factor [Kofleriaceae bacterium]|nr:sigma-70 family RNA polymerase sigma factor [Myxococcales bacterium]MCB9563363.1 sigma-70 family RNA polymerase sigma factor [Kofleriaceae bacterium]MCB9573653.1 sigma-70 family RNA polymerase sigma factor [Kofleriaceae bacterium]
MDGAIQCDPCELARLVKAGDVASLDRMTRCYGERLLAVGRRYCGDPERARDAVQDAMLAAGEHLADFRGDGSLEGWLIRMVASFCRRMQRGRKHDAALHEELDDDRAADDGDGPADDAARGELLRILGDALLTLDPRDRALVLLADAEDWTAPEIGAQLDMTPEAVRTRLSRAHRRLRDALGPVHDAL